MIKKVSLKAVAQIFAFPLIEQQSIKVEKEKNNCNWNYFKSFRRQKQLDEERRLREEKKRQKQEQERLEQQKRIQEQERRQKQVKDHQNIIFLE